MIVKLARKSLAARWGRNFFIGIMITAGVSFVAGSFILADSMKKTFNDLFDEISQNVDLQVRSTLVGVDETQAVRDALPLELVDEVAAVDGVEYVEGSITRNAQLLDRDGDPIRGTGPALGLSWDSDVTFANVQVRDGRPPDGPTEVALDKATADNNDFEVGDEITIVFDAGQQTFQIVGLVGMGDSDGLAGATGALFDPETAQDVLNAQGTVDSIEVKVADGYGVADVQASIERILPGRVEVVTGQQVADETNEAINEIIDLFATGLLIFAFVTAFVAAFIINNIFGITISQRLRELALLRSVGANAKQVRRLIVAEALVVSVSASLVGIFGGFLVAQGIMAIFNAAGGGFPDLQTTLLARTVIVAMIVGIGVTLLSVLLPARRAARIPPVAALRPELGFTALSASRRMIGGAIVTGVGGALFLYGLFIGDGIWPGFSIGGGALLVFLGITSLSTTVARPVSRFIGAPIERLFGTPGKFARDNASRAPRRTARTASALMIGVALISAAAIFAASLRDTFIRILDRSITADYIVTDESFQGLPPTIAERMAELDELSAVSPWRFVTGTANGDQRSFSAIDPVAFPDLVNLDVTDGDYGHLVDGNGVMMLRSDADDLDVSVGDTIDVTYQNGAESELTVSGLFEDDSLDGGWYISLDELERVSTQPPRDFFVLGRLADDVDPAAARPVMEEALSEFPQATLQDNAEFRAEQEDQINQLLVVISTLLGMAILLSFLGIAITLALSVFERTREIGLLRAVGMTRRQLRRAVRWEAVIVSVFGVVVGVVVGLLMGTALSLAVPNSIIDGITLPWNIIVIVLIGAIVAAVVAAWYPARKASKMDVLEAIATE